MKKKVAPHHVFQSMTMELIGNHAKVLQDLQQIVVTIQRNVLALKACANVSDEQLEAELGKIDEAIKAEREKVADTQAKS